MTCARLLQPLAAALLLVSFAAAPARGQDVTLPTYDSFYVFGDSLADNGNVWLSTGGPLNRFAPPPSGAYFQGRFSNGPVAFEYLWQRLSGARPGSPGALQPVIAGPSGPAVNFAFGGTGSSFTSITPGGFPAPGLLGQVGYFAGMLAGNRPSPHALYAIVTGANDYTNPTPLDPWTVTANIAEAVRQLDALGAGDIIVLTMPNLGCLPYGAPGQCLEPAQAGSPAPGQPPTPSQLTALHNMLLTQTLSQLQLQNARVKIVDVNVVFSLMRRVTVWKSAALDFLVPPVDPAAPTSACLFIDPATCPTLTTFSLPRLPKPQFLFWDVVHPTTDAHRVLGEYLYFKLRRSTN